MRKAFLSHNSADKIFVTSVAKHLTRNRIVFDKFVFEEAVDFRDSIQKGLNETDLFVLFASEQSLKASWVKYELDEAELRLINGTIKNILIFLIGNASHEDLPKWCQKKKVIPVPNATQTARIIQNNLIKVSEQKEVFIGRDKEVSAFTNHLFMSKSNSQVLVFVGLQGQGRRTFAKNVLNQNYSLEIGPEYEFSQDQTLTDLYVQLLYEDNDEISKKDLAICIKFFEEATIDDKISEIIRILKRFVDYRTAPMIIDKGGLLNSEGQYHDHIIKLIEEVNKIPNLYLVFIQTRNPYGYKQSQPFFVTYIGELTDVNMSLLVFTLLRNLNISVPREEIQELANYLDGYPPAANYATNLARQVGMPILLRDKKILTEFKAGIFTSYLKGIVGEDSIKHSILKILGSMSPIPYQVLESIVDCEPTQLLSIMKELINTSVIYPVDNKYALALPLRESVRAICGYLNEQDYKRIAIKLKNKFWDSENLPEPIILDMLIVSLSRAKLDDELEEFSGIIFPSSMLKAAKSAYSNNDWELSKKLSYKVLELDSSRDGARVILVKSLIRLNEQQEADRVLNELRENNHPQYHTLKGFKHLKKREYQQAINSYKNALRNGDQSKPVYRGIAECYYWCGEYDNAENYINNALGNGSTPNRFIVDLAAKIAIEKEDFDKAKQYIDILEIVDRKENVDHRKAVFLSKQELWEQALQHSESACLRQPPLPEMFLTKAHIQIILGKRTEAKQTLYDIIDIFKTYEKKDTYLGLQCKFYITMGEWNIAESYFNKLQNKSAKYYKSFKLQILKLKVLDTSISLYERKTFEEEIKSLEDDEVYDKELEIKFYEEVNVDLM